MDPDVIHVTRVIAAEWGRVWAASDHGRPFRSHGTGHSSIDPDRHRPQAGVAWTHYHLRKARLEAGTPLGSAARQLLAEIETADGLSSGRQPDYPLCERPT